MCIGHSMALYWAVKTEAGMAEYTIIYHKVHVRTGTNNEFIDVQTCELRHICFLNHDLRLLGGE